MKSPPRRAAGPVVNLLNTIALTNLDRVFRASLRLLCLPVLGLALIGGPSRVVAAPKRSPGAAHGKATAGRKTIPARPSRPVVRRGRSTGKRPALVVRRVPVVPALRGGLPNVQAQGALVIDLDSGKELYGRNADQVRAIASISKLAAGLVVLDRGLDLDGVTVITRTDADVARGGATSRLLPGMALSNRDLLHAAMLGSDNRAVSALGRAVGLDAPRLAEAMTRKATQLGLTHTRFRDPTGLSPENVSTARETIRLLKAAMAHPLLGPILATTEYDAHPLGRGVVTYVNTHRPAHRINTEVLGGKTGYNNPARYCLVLAARIDGRSYGMAFLGTEGKLTRFGDVFRVSDWIVTHRAKPPTPIPSPSPSPSPTLAEPALVAAPVDGDELIESATAAVEPPPVAPLLTPAVIAKPAAPENKQ